MNTRDTLYVENGRLIIGGADAKGLAEKFGTPLYVMDEAYIRKIMRAFKDTLDRLYSGGNIAYASKAFSCEAIYAVAKSENIMADVASAGEIHTAVKAGFDAKSLIFHGNAKTDFEIGYALDNGVGLFVADSLDEIDALESACAARGIEQEILLRCNPGVDAHTHKFVQTAKPDSKFGFNIANGAAAEAVRAVKNCPHLIYKGVHCHIGSQIFDKNAFSIAADIITDFTAALASEGIRSDVLDLGGGFGVYYTDGDPEFGVEEYCGYLESIIRKVSDCVERKKLARPVLIFEPGRSIVAEAGITLYRAVCVKEIKGIKNYVAVDGGMGDNIRPALYEAAYEAVVADRADADTRAVYDIAGKFCESSDILIKNQKLPDIKKGDVIAVFSTGAYNYSMASNYNRNPIPAVVLVNDGQADLIVRRQRLEDLTLYDEIPERLKEC